MKTESVNVGDVSYRRTAAIRTDISDLVGKIMEHWANVQNLLRIKAFYSIKA